MRFYDYAVIYMRFYGFYGYEFLREREHVLPLELAPKFTLLTGLIMYITYASK